MKCQEEQFSKERCREKYQTERSEIRTKTAIVLKRKCSENLRIK